jgi:hypothetical protein
VLAHRKDGFRNPSPHFQLRSDNSPFARNEIVRRVLVNFMAVRAFKPSSRLISHQLVSALTGICFAPFCGEALQAGFAFHQPG